MRHLIFDINGFNETLPASWEWDVRRLSVRFVAAVKAGWINALVEER